MKILFAMTALVCLSMNVNAQNMNAYGVQINCTDMKKGIQFYRDVLGFKIENIDSTTAVLKPAAGNVMLLLHKVNYLLPMKQTENSATLTFQVNNLDTTMNRLKARGLSFENYQKRKEGVGYAIYFSDPFGTRFSMMEITVGTVTPFSEPKIYNYGYYISDMTLATDFFTKTLSFTVLSTKYLPLDLPVGNPDKSFGFMLHTRPGIEAVHFNSTASEHLVVLFKTDNISEVSRIMAEKGVKVIETTNDPKMRTLSFYDPFGYLSKVIERKE